jgi:hypothetical protein
MERGDFGGCFVLEILNLGVLVSLYYWAHP